MHSVVQLFSRNARNCPTPNALLASSLASFCAFVRPSLSLSCAIESGSVAQLVVWLIRLLRYLVTHYGRVS